ARLVYGRPGPGTARHSGDECQPGLQADRRAAPLDRQRAGPGDHSAPLPRRRDRPGAGPPGRRARLERSRRPRPDRSPEPPLGDIQAECYGVTVNSRDLAQVTEADRKRVNGLVLAAIFLILIVVVRRLWLALYLLATVLLSYYATLGATTLVGSWWAGRPLG